MILGLCIKPRSDLFYRDAAPIIPETRFHNFYNAERLIIIKTFKRSFIRKDIRGDAYMITVDKEKCARCGGCVAVCPVDALSLTEHGISCSEKCIDCSTCVRFCPVKALALMKKGDGDV